MQIYEQNKCYTCFKLLGFIVVYFAALDNQTKYAYQLLEMI